MEFFRHFFNKKKQKKISLFLVGTHAKKLMTIECDIGSKNSPSSFQTQCATRHYDEMVSSNNESQNVHEIAANSILWMSRRLGPVLTAKHVTRNLLKMLTLCYTGPGALASTPLTPCDELGAWKLSISRHKVKLFNFVQFLWGPQANHKNPWDLMGPSGKPWKPVGPHGALRQAIKICETR